MKLCSSNNHYTTAPHHYTTINGQEPTFTITDTKLYAHVETLSTQDNAKLLEQLKSGFKRTTN